MRIQNFRHVHAWLRGTAVAAIISLASCGGGGDSNNTGSTAGENTNSPPRALGARYPVNTKAPDISSGKQPGAFPETVDLTKWAVPVGDQGSVGSCVAWTIAYGLMGWYENRDTGGHISDMFAPMYMYSQINFGRHFGLDLGSLPADGFELAVRQGNDVQGNYSKDNFEWKVKPTESERKNASKYKFFDFQQLFAGRHRELGEFALKRALAEGTPVAISILVRQGFDNLQDGLDTDTTSPARGLHQVLALGYDSEGLLIQNSWGTTWGNHGYGRLSWAVVRQDVVEANVFLAPASKKDVRSYVPKAADNGGAGYVSYLRVVNKGTTETPVTVERIDGADGSVGPRGQLVAALPAGASMTFTAAQIETAMGVSLAASDRPRIRLISGASPIGVQSLLRQPHGAFEEMSEAQTGSAVTVDSYVPAAVESSGYVSQLRVINTGRSATSISVAKIDPVTGKIGSPKTLAALLPGGAAVTYTAAQVEAALGTPIAAAERPRIVVASTGAVIEVQSFQLNPGGVLTNVSTAQLGTSIAVRSYVPAAVDGYTSYLRVINDSATATPVTASLIDDAGTILASGTLVDALPANGATTLVSSKVESALGVRIAAASRPRIKISTPSGLLGLRTQSFMLQPSGVFNEVSNATSASSVIVGTFVPAADAPTGYGSYLRVINPTAVTTKISVALIGENGVTSHRATLIESLSAGAAKTLDSSQVEAALGTTIPAASRPRIQIVSEGAPVIEVQSFMIQPGGAFTEVSGAQ